MSRYGGALSDQHAVLLEASGIDPVVARERGYVTADTKKALETRGFSPAQRNVPALVIPLWRVDGEQVGTQARPDLPRFGSTGKPVKYETPTKQSMVVDVHPRIREEVRDPQRPLFVTEGVRKADAAISAGLTCVALLGVWNWRGSDDGALCALPDWELIHLKGRQTFIVFDSDVTLKPQVREAMVRLKRFLEMRGAEVAIIYLPAGEGGAKVGLDDYLAAGHTVDDLLRHARVDVVRVETAELVDTFDDVAEETGAQLFDDVAAFIRRFVRLPSEHDLVAIVLWVAHTHGIEAFESTPRLNLSSAEKQCGKTRTLEVIELLARNARHTVNMSTAYLFRIVDEWQPTLLVDEVDTIFNPKLGAANEALRGLINAGHRRGATVGRMIGEGTAMTPHDFPVYCPVALAGIGMLPDTVHDRSIIIRLRRRKSDEVVEPFRAREAGAEGHAIRRRLSAWASRNAAALADARPVMPDGIADRPADVWEPMLAVADVAGGRWPELARGACVHLNEVRLSGEHSLGAGLLADIREVFRERGRDRMTSEELCEQLAALPEARWANIRGKAIDQRQLAGWLKLYEVAPTTIRIGSVTKRGYMSEWFFDAWARYLPPESATSKTSATEQVGRVSDDPGVADASATLDGCETPVTSDVADVAPVTPSGEALFGAAVGRRERVAL